MFTFFQLSLRFSVQLSALFFPPLSFLFSFASRQILLENNIHSWWRWLEENFFTSFSSLSPSSFYLVVGVEAKVSCDGKSSNWNKQWIFFFPLLAVCFPPCEQRRNIKAHMAHSPLNWWDSLLGGALAYANACVTFFPLSLSVTFAEPHSSASKHLCPEKGAKKRTKIPSIWEHVDKYLN